MGPSVEISETLNMVGSALLRRLASQSASLVRIGTGKSTPALSILSRSEGTDAGSSSAETRPTIRKFDPVQRENLTDFGKYVADCMPKYVQKVQLTAGDELEVLISPEGIIPVLSFLKDHLIVTALILSTQVNNPS